MINVLWLSIGLILGVIIGVTQMDKITLEQALTGEPAWMMVYATEPTREIEVSMTYAELMAIKKLWDNRDKLGSEGK